MRAVTHTRAQAKGQRYGSFIEAAGKQGVRWSLERYLFFFLFFYRVSLLALSLGNFLSRPGRLYRLGGVHIPEAG